jgi:hypothetical protein
MASKAIHVGSVYFIIVFMKPNVFNVDSPDFKINCCNEAIFIARNIEYLQFARFCYTPGEMEVIHPWRKRFHGIPVRRLS